MNCSKKKVSETRNCKGDAVYYFARQNLNKIRNLHGNTSVLLRY